MRKLKSEKSEKAKIDMEVAKLLDLKRQLANAQGVSADQGSGKKKKGGKGQSTPNSKPQAATTNHNKAEAEPASQPPVNQAEIDRLTQAVSAQVHSSFELCSVYCEQKDDYF